MTGVGDRLAGVSNDVVGCFGMLPGAVGLQFAAETFIALSFFGILAGLVWLTRRRPDLAREYRMLIIAGGAFLALSGIAHALGALSPLVPWSGAFGIAYATAAVLASIMMMLVWPLLPRVAQVPSAAQLASADERLRREVEGHEQTLRELEASRRDLELRVADRTQELSDVSARLETVLRRYEIALRGSHMTLFTQDRDLRFTSISNPLFGRDVPDILGRTDEEILPAESRAQFGQLARTALATGRAQGGEVSVREGDKTRWYELHIEPLPAPEGAIVGVTSALFDITERKTGESHLRLLMRELTHRSKNLLAVIQAMARQTARHSGTIESFLETFGARLQALATSHDLLVQEGWHGASLQDLTAGQLAKYVGGEAARVTLDGPAVHLKPAAAQSFGLALHELAMNAEQYGALSVPSGKVEVAWRFAPVGKRGESGVEIIWMETNGPDVVQPVTRGFGSLVIEKNLSRALDADVALSFEPSGVRCRMGIPAEHLLATR